NEGGDAISFLMKVSQMTYPEALRQLAARAGVVLPERHENRGEPGRPSHREQLYHINGLAAAHFAKNLAVPAGKMAREYLVKRAIRPDTVAAFNLGYAPDSWRNLRDYLEKEKLSLKMAEELGLLVPREGGGAYDRFRGRLIFPIEDISGRVIAFGGRIMGEGVPKYMNSPESDIYTKGRHLYGLSRTREDIRQKGYAILVEGYFDLIVLWNFGIKNVVATLGTALTNEHVDLIRRYTQNMAVIFDSDEAGKKALTRSISLFLAGNVKAKAVVLPDGFDPDDYVRAHGKDGLENIIQQSGSIVDYYIDHVIGERRGLEEKREALREAIVLIKDISSASEQGLFIRRVAERLGIDQDVLRKEVRQTTTGNQKIIPRPSEREKGAVLDAVELLLIRIMLEFPAKIPMVDDSNVLLYVTNSELKQTAETIIETFKRSGKIDVMEIIKNSEQNAIRERLMQLMVNESPYDETVIERVTTDAIKKIKQRWYKERRKDLQIELRKAENEGNMSLSDQLVLEQKKLILEEKGL
ncbi:MAG: DNA primase, partial [Syntrophaceae bacterium]|nr:DNA primase [Syntrophaceae bacterium]